MNDPIRRNAYEQIEERQRRRHASRWLLAILLPVALIFTGGCIACMVLVVG